MELHIHDKRTIHEIQKEFSQLFPNLKLEVFAEPCPHEKNTSHNKLLMHPSKAIGECRDKHLKGTLSISPQMTVSDLKKGFNTNYGLCVEVFRKVGNDWLETTVGVWPLEKQNATTTESNSENTLEVV